MEEAIIEADLAHIEPQQLANQASLACLDFKDSLSKWRLWAYLGWNDIKMRYRGSILGPFWITASMMIFIAVFSLVYSRLFHQALSEYIPFLTAGYLVWIMISTSLVESCNIYIEATAIITEIKLPYSLYIFRLAWRHVIIFFHNLLVFCVIALYFKVPMNWSIFLIIPGLLLVLVNLFSITLMLAILGTKYRDIPQVITSLIQVAFFVTPISWEPKLLNQSLIISCNPLNYLIELVRSPLLGHTPPMMTWAISIVISIVVFSLAFSLFVRLRRNIPFWL